MKNSHVRLALAVLTACATAPLLAQVPVPNTPPQGTQPTAQPQTPPPPQTMAPMAPPPKPTSFQVMGAMTIPTFSYADYLDNIGWMAGASLVVRRGAFNNIRLDGEYNSTNYDPNLALSGSAELYGGGVGGGRVVMKGNLQSEGYFILGGYQHSFATCTNNNCTTAGEFQFGTKLGVNLVMGRGKVKPIIDLHWLTTWSQPYANIIGIGAGLRF